MPSMTTPWKHPKTGVYYFRRGIPKDIQSVLGKGAVLKRSLRTKDPQEAKVLIVPHIAESDDMFRMARLKSNPNESVSLTARDAARIASRWYERMKQEAEDKAGDIGLVTKVVDSMGNVNFVDMSFDLHVMGSEIKYASDSSLDRLGRQLQEYIDSQLKIEGVSSSPGTENYRLLAKEFYPFIYELEKLSKARMQSDWSYTPKVSIADEPLSFSLDTKPSLNFRDNSLNESKVKLSQILTEFRKSEDIKANGSLSRSKTLDGYEASFKRLIEIIGDVPIESVRSKHIVKFRDTCLQLPKEKSKAIRALLIDEQVAYANANKAPTITPSTVSNFLRHISVVFSYAVETGEVDSNPVTCVQKPASSKPLEASELERGYNLEDLDKIFSHPIFLDKNLHKPYGWACYWVPLICRYTGARLNEIGQLHKSDFNQENGIHFLEIRRGNGRSVKTNSSLRRIPMHHHLIELGLIDFVTSSDSGPLFPDIPRDQYGSTSSKFSPWWSKVVRSQGVTSTAPAHEFRHTVKTEIRALGISDSVSDRITGHSPRGEGARYGGLALIEANDVLNGIQSLALKRL